MGLKHQDREVLVRLKLEKSRMTLSDAKTIFSLGMWAAAANRLYYAAYYSVSALLLENGISVKTHEGVIQMFSLHFVKTGKLPREIGKKYNALFGLRLTGDYEDEYNLCEEEVRPMLAYADDVVEAAQSLMKIKLKTNTNNN